MYINFKKHLSRKTAAILTAVLIVITTLFIYQGFVQTQSNRETGESLEKELAEVFVKTMIYCNQTRLDIIKSYYGIPHSINLSRRDIVELIGKYHNLSETLFFQENFPFTKNNDMPVLQRILWRAFQSYYLVANNTLLVYDTSKMLDEIMPGIAKSLTYLAECNVDKGIEEYSRIEPKLVKVISNLNKVYYDLSSIDEKTLLSEEHRNTLREAINTTSKILTSLTKYRQLMLLIKKNPQQYKEMCLYSHDQLKNISQNTQQLLKKLSGILQKISNLGSATSGLNALSNTISNALIKASSISNNQQGTGTNQSNQGSSGGGAGYHNLTETD